MRTGTTGTGTAHQNTDMVSKRAALRRRIANVRVVQAIYMPCVPQLLAKHSQGLRPAPANDVTDLPEDQPLFFPHQVNIEDLEHCTSGIAEIEERLRDAQLHSSLDALRIALHVKTRLITFKNRNVRHQGPNTRARRKIDVNEAKIVAHAEKYRKARSAKFALSGPGQWEMEWRELGRTDVRTMLSADDPVNSNSGEQSEGRRTTSWIWMAADMNAVDDSVQSGMQDGTFPSILLAIQAV